MAIYRNIHISFWQDEDMIELTPEQKYFYLYLMTNSKTNQSGCYKISNKVMQFETGYNKDTVSKLLQYFVDQQKIGYSEATQEIILYNWLNYNWSSSPKVKACIEKNIKDIVNIEFRDWLIDYIKIQYGYSINTVAIPNRNKNKNKHKEEIKEVKESDKSLDILFDYFWSKYPNKKDKKKSHDKYLRTLKADGNPKALHGTILSGLLSQIEWRSTMQNSGKWIPDWKLPITWLNGECWNDELESVKSDIKKRIEFNNTALFPKSYKAGHICVVCDDTQRVFDTSGNEVKCPCINYDNVPLPKWDKWKKYYIEVGPLSYIDFINKEN